MKASFIKFIEFDDAVIGAINREYLGKLSNDEIKTITKNTVNTWQPYRKDSELISNTLQGKIVEEVFSEYVTRDSDLCFIPYDKFRVDAFKKHAPFDGLLMKADNPFVKEGIKRIVESYSRNHYRYIDKEEKEWLRQNGIYTVEIKSSKIPKNDYPADLSNFLDRNIQAEIIGNLKQRDFFVYPVFTRTHGNKIHNFEDYINHVREKYDYKKNWSQEKLISDTLDFEKKSACDIYTRIFVHDRNKDEYVCYLLGYAIRDDFYSNPKIINMPQIGKSELAIYYVYPIAKSLSIKLIFGDDRLWDL
ncbi:hypothetical protein ACTGXS_02445 [Streptococcus suis]